MWFRRNEAPWEVVDSKAVELVSMYDEDELSLTVVSSTVLSGAYSVACGKSRALDVPSAVRHTRARLLHEAARRGYNVLLLEGWRLTLLRKQDAYRLEVRYTGRPAHAKGALPPRSPPPFLAVVEQWQALGRAYILDGGARAWDEGCRVCDDALLGRRVSRPAPDEKDDAAQPEWPEPQQEKPRSRWRRESWLRRLSWSR